MGSKLATPQEIVTPSEISGLALTHARLKAWWNGEPAPAQDALPKKAKGNDKGPSVEGNEGQVQSAARAALWGASRSYPSSVDFDAQLVQEVAGPKAARIAVFGRGTASIARLIADQSAAKVEIFEEDKASRALTEKTLKGTKQAKRCGFHDFDWNPGSLPKSKADGALFLFQGGQEGRLEAGAFCAERVLRAGASALWLDFFAEHDDETLDATRGFEARTFRRPDEATIAFAASGLTVTADDDWSAPFLDAYGLAWQDLAAQLGLRQAALIKEGGQQAGSAALQDLMCWKARISALRSGQLAVRRYLLTA
jgi:hypothetical protein